MTGPPRRPRPRPIRRLLTALKQLDDVPTGPRYDAYADGRYVLHPDPETPEVLRTLTADQVPVYLAGLADAAQAILRADLPAPVRRRLLADYATPYRDATDAAQPPP